tara:strand:- start:2453 stop:3034 length:582 start_codon:yes stop_codon:yes gene_type:complete
MSDQNYVLLLNGYPGVGKLTVAEELARHINGLHVIDNHMLNNPIFALVRENGTTEIPSQAWESIRNIRKIVLTALSSYASPNLNFVFTNCLAEEDQDDVNIYDQIKESAEQSQRLFIPVLLTCSLEENKKRITAENREAKMKMRDANNIAEMREDFTLVGKNHPHAAFFDTTNLSPQDTAVKVRNHIQQVLTV